MNSCIDKWSPARRNHARALPQELRDGIITADQVLVRSRLHRDEVAHFGLSIESHAAPNGVGNRDIARSNVFDTLRPSGSRAANHPARLPDD